MSYNRVIPRDLFNEAKLLKCLGQLALLIHEGKGIRWPLQFEHSTSGSRDNEDREMDDRKGFVIELRSSDGGLYCDNLELWCHDRIIHLYTSLNSREPYPLLFSRGWEYDTEDEVFNNDGTLSQEFTDFLDKRQKEADAESRRHAR